MPKKKIGYVRVSSQKQADEGLSPANQKARLIAYGCDVVLQDIRSGQKADRRSYQQICQLVKKGEVEEVVAIRLDRIGRSVIEAYKFYTLLEEHDVKLTLLDMQVDLATSSGKLFFSQLAAFAQFEVDLLAEKQKSQHEYKRAHRMAVMAPFGYTFQVGNLYKDESLYGDTKLSCWQIAREVIDAYLTIGTERGTNKYLGHKYGFTNRYKLRKDFPRTGTGLGDWLVLPALRGHRHYPATNEFYPNQHEALISEGEYQTILMLQKKARALRGHAGPDAKSYPLSGLVKCVCTSNCSVGIGGNKKYGEHVYYCCDAHRKRQCNDQPEGGRRRSLRADFLEHYVITELTQHSQLAVQAVQEAANDGEVTVSDEVLAVEQQIKQMEKDRGEGKIGEIMQKAIDELRAERDNMLAQAGLSRPYQNLEELKELLENLSDPNFFKELPSKHLQRVFYMFIERVIIKGNEIIQIDFKF